MGRAEREILARFRDADSRDQAWDSSRIARLIYPADANSSSKVRQTYRALERARIVPRALTADDLITRFQCNEFRAEVQSTIQYAQAKRKQISIVQAKEVRLGQWAIVWNNLRLAKQWVWTNQMSPAGFALQAVGLSLVKAHRLPCVLLFDPSAFSLRNGTLSMLGHRMQRFGDHGVGYEVHDLVQIAL